MRGESGYGRLGGEGGGGRSEEKTGERGSRKGGNFALMLGINKDV